MNKIIKLCLIIVLFASSFAGCVKLNEEMSVKIIERPRYDIETPVNPSWDTIPRLGNDTLGK